MVWPGPQEHRSLSLFFSFSRLVTCDCSINLSRTWGSCELPPKWKGNYYQGMLIHFVENVLFNSCIFLKRLARHGVEPKNNRDLGQSCFYQPIFNKSWAEEYITYDGVGLKVSFCFFCGRTDSIWCFLVIPGEYGLPALARIAQFIF